MSREKFYSKEEIVSPRHRLWKGRRSLRLTQQGLADSLGWKPSKIRDLELGKQKITMEIALAIEEQYCIYHRWLLYGEEPMLREGPLAMQDMVLRDVTAQEGDQEEPRFYEIVEEFSGKVTFVTEDEMRSVHRLLAVLKAGDEGVVQAVKSNLATCVRLCQFINTRFGDIIILERRVKQMDISFPDRRKKAVGE